MSEWQLKPLDQLVCINPSEKLSKGTVAKKIGMEYLLPFTKRLSGYQIEEYKGGTKFRNGDTLLARITPCLENGKTAYVNILDTDEVAFGSTEYIVLRELQNVSDKQFIYYFSRSEYFRDIAIALMTGSSGRQRVQTDSLSKYLFEFPPLPEQKAIADVLSALDDKIDLLQRQNETLEKMAETLFRQWFIEEAKEDWEEVAVGDFGVVVCGKTPSKKNESYYGNDIPFLKIPDMHGNIFISTTTDNLSLDGSESQIKKLLPKNSICVSCIATVGLVCINDVELHTNQQINSIVLDNNKYLYFLFLTMKSMYEELHNLASGGTATLNLNTGDFSKILISKPDEELLESFNKVAFPSFEKIRSNAKQIQTLQNLRDTLLPKLMSGEVRVKLD